MKKPESTGEQIPSDSPHTEPKRADIEMVAYLIWKQEGHPHGNHETHWLQAETQLRQDRT